MLPTLQSLTSYDKELLQDLTQFVHKISCYDEVIDLIQPFMNEAIEIKKTANHLTRYLEYFPNAIFNYFITRIRQLPCMKSDTIQTCFQRWSKSRDENSVRFVWLLIENGDFTILNKSALYYQDISQCLSAAWRYKPSYDYIDARSFELLTYEVRAVGEFALPNPIFRHYRTIALRRVNEDKTTTRNFIDSKGTRYPFEITGDHVTIKMPWHVLTDNDEKLYIYYIKKNDRWVYSFDSSIKSAYHQYLHM